MIFYYQKVPLFLVVVTLQFTEQGPGLAHALPVSVLYLPLQLDRSLISSASISLHRSRCCRRGQQRSCRAFSRAGQDGKPATGLEARLLPYHRRCGSQDEA
jgi:hypothetical protein